MRRFALYTLAIVTIIAIAAPVFAGPGMRYDAATNSFRVPAEPVKAKMHKGYDPSKPLNAACGEPWARKTDGVYFKGNEWGSKGSDDPKFQFRLEGNEFVLPAGPIADKLKDHPGWIEMNVFQGNWENPNWLYGDKATFDNWVSYPMSKYNVPDRSAFHIEGVPANLAK